MSKKTILITGSSSGIGKVTAKIFHDKGWNVIATMRSPEKETELGALDNVLVTRLDVLDSDSIAKAVEQGIAKFGKIDVLVNNAGYGAWGVLEATPMDKVRRQFDVNVIGLIETTKAVLPHFRSNLNGTIINISSLGGKVTFPLGSLYLHVPRRADGADMSCSICNGSLYRLTRSQERFNSPFCYAEHICRSCHNWAWSFYNMYTGPWSSVP